MHDVEISFPAFPPPLRVPSMLVMSGIKDEVIVEEGEIKIEKQLTIILNIDHRFTDGMRGAKAQNSIRMLLESPDSLL